MNDFYSLISIENIPKEHAVVVHIIYIYTLWFIIRDNVTYEGFRVLDYLLKKHTYKA